MPTRSWPAARVPKAADRRDWLAAALDVRQRSREIWADLTARKLVSPVDTGRVSASERALARTEQLARTP